MILDAERIAERMTAMARDPREFLLSFYPEAPIPPLDHVVRTATPLVARVNGGVWIASCECGARGTPAPGSVVWLSQPLLWCVRCGNQAVGHGWRPVSVPSRWYRDEIEAVLDFRPNASDRNWEIHESISDLARQNIVAGDPVTEAA